MLRDIARAVGLSLTRPDQIRNGRVIPHPKHWGALTGLEESSQPANPSRRGSGRRARGGEELAKAWQVMADRRRRRCGAAGPAQLLRMSIVRTQTAVGARYLRLTAFVRRISRVSECGDREQM